MEYKGPLERYPDDPLRVAFVGPCASGKSTVVDQLRDLGIDARMPAQEHSDVKDMWEKLLHPDLLVFLDAPNEVLRERREGVTDLSDEYLEDERRRLTHAFANADVSFDTSVTPSEEIVQAVLALLNTLKP